MSDGPGIMHSLATWLHWSPPSDAQTNASVHTVQGLQKLTAAMEEYPHLRIEAEKLAKSGMKDPWQILGHFKLANRQFRFRRR
jgi:hypothetical protein